MVRPLDAETKRRVIDLWMAGHYYRDISSKLMISIGSISNIINEESTRTPDIEDLRRLKTALNTSNASIMDSIRGANFLNQLNKLTIPISSLKEALDFYLKYGEKAFDILAQGQRLSTLESSQGRPYESIISDADEKALQREKDEERLSKLREDIQQEKESLQELERLRTLHTKMAQHGITISKLDNLVDQSIKLEEHGFTPDTAEFMAKELANLGLDPQKAASKLTKILSEYQTLDKATLSLQAKNDQIGRSIKTGQDQLKDQARQLEISKNRIKQYEQLEQRERGAYRDMLKQQQKSYSLKLVELENKHRKREQELNRAHAR